MAKSSSAALLGLPLRSKKQEIPLLVTMSPPWMRMNVLPPNCPVVEVEYHGPPKASVPPPVQLKVSSISALGSLKRIALTPVEVLEPPLSAVVPP